MREKRPRQMLDALQDFLTTPLAVRLERHRLQSPQAAVLALFHEVVRRVPAYRDFLAKHGIVPETVRSFADFERLPLTDKPGYVLRYPLASRCRDGRLNGCDMLAVSSGSTGRPTVWPRALSDEYAVASRFEQVFHDSFRADTRSTLAVVCFSLGTWVGGLYTAACCRHLAAKGYPITVATPGNHKDEIVRVVQELGGAFEQIVLLGYPPFIKDMVDSGRASGIDWARLRVKTVFAGEVFSEEWCSLVLERLGAADPCFASASLYGTADAGVLGNETPLSIYIRRFLAAHPEAARELFGESRLPTLVQYDPLARFFEVRDGTLLFSGDNGVPLIRYHIADSGGLIPFESMLAFLKARGCDPLAALGPVGSRGVRDLPFVYVFGRADFTVSFFGANVYPENIAVGLEQPGIRDWVTGKFVLQVQEDADHNPRLAVVVELAPQAQASEERRVAVTESILGQLLRLNSEFAHYVPAEYRIPQVTLAAHGDPAWFPPGVKHRYTRR
jgi:phenylacetate-CoA ligase